LRFGGRGNDRGGNPVVGQDKPMMQDKPMQQGMEKPKMHRHVHHHYHHNYHHHMAKPPITDKM
jgi:hypothetical protein